MTELSDVARAFFEGRNFAHVATILPDGSPHVVPVWIDMHGDKIILMTGPNSLKARNLGRDPRVSLSITETDNPYRMAHVRGRAIDRLDGDEGWALVDQIAIKFTGNPYPREQEEIIFVIEPETFFTQSFD